MINKEVTEKARQVLGNFLSQKREEKGITKYRLCKNSGLTTNQVLAIEDGSTSYTVDALLAYVAGIDCYFNLTLPDREGKHLDQQDMIDKMADAGDQAG